MAEQDDLVENYDDDASFGASAADEEAKILAFQKKVKGYRKTILSPKQYPVEKRLEAVKMLGELGEVEAIPDLVKVYHRDKSPGMKAAAAQALGMFKALDEALNDTEMPERQEYAQTLIEGIVLRDAIGKRSPFKRRPLMIVMAVLFVVFAVLSMIALMTAGPKAERAAAAATAVALQETQFAMSVSPTPTTIQPTGIPTPTDVTTVVALLRNDYQALTDDTAWIHEEMLKSTREQALLCVSAPPALKKSTPIVLPASLAQSALAPIAATLAKAHTDLDPIVATYEEACRAKRSIPPADANSMDGTIISIQRALGQIPSQLSQVADMPVVNTPDPSVTIAPTNTLVPTATLDARKFAKHITGIRQIAASMTSSNGSNTVLIQYWDDVSKSGSTGGCRNLPAPILPEDYVLPDDIAQGAPQELLTALENLNTGLTLSRQSWNAFERFCADRSLSSIASTQYTAASTAQKAFQTVPGLLTTVEAILNG